jgi:hypothetical protein
LLSWIENIDPDNFARQLSGAARKECPCIAIDLQHLILLLLTLAVRIPATSKAAGTAGAAPNAGMDEIIDRMKCGHAGDEGVMD